MKTEVTSLRMLGHVTDLERMRLEMRHPLTTQVEFTQAEQSEETTGVQTR